MLIWRKIKLVLYKKTQYKNIFIEIGKLILKFEKAKKLKSLK